MIPFTKPAIKVWPYYDAPKNIRDAVCSDDCDYIAVVPAYLKDKWIHWLEVPHFACYEVKQYPLANGDMIYAGYHS